MSVVFLMYHGLGEPPLPERTGARYHISEALFAQHLAWMQRDRLNLLKLEQALSARGSQRGVVFTFDDGERSCMIAAELLEKIGASATMYVTSSFINTSGYMTGADLRELHARGFTIGAHGATHRYLSDLDDRDLATELRDSKSQLEELLGAAVHHMSLPGGRGDARVIGVASRVGFESVATSNAGLHRGEIDPYAIRRLAIVRGMRDRRFQALVRGDRIAHATSGLVVDALGAVKKSVGNQRYERIRGALLGLVGRK